MNAPAKLIEILPVQVALKLNGQEVQAYEGETILTVAKRVGIEIPHLCYKEGYRADGNCRACVVDIKGERTLAKHPELAAPGNETLLFDDLAGFVDWLLAKQPR